MYSPIVPRLTSFATNRFPPDSAMPIGSANPETSEALIVAPVVALYSPIVPAPKFVSKICPRLVAGMTQTVADATKPKRIKRMFTMGFSRNRTGKSFQRITHSKPRAGTAWPIRIGDEFVHVGLTIARTKLWKLCKIISYAASMLDVSTRSRILFSLGPCIFNKVLLTLFINGVGPSHAGRIPSLGKSGFPGFWSFSVAHFVP